MIRSARRNITIGGPGQKVILKPVKNFRTARGFPAAANSKGKGGDQVEGVEGRDHNQDAMVTETADRAAR